MKTTIKELKEDEPLEIITVSHQLKMTMPSEISDRKLENKQIYTKVFTDGIITKKQKKSRKKITEYFFDDKEKYDGNVDILRKTDLYFKNYSYVITYLIAKENSNCSSFQESDVVKNISIYLRNRMDIKALKKVKKIIKDIDRYSMDHSISLIPYGLEECDTEKSDGTVCVLKKQKKINRIF